LAITFPFAPFFFLSPLVSSLTYYFSISLPASMFVAFNASYSYFFFLSSSFFLSSLSFFFCPFDKPFVVSSSISCSSPSSGFVIGYYFYIVAGFMNG